MDLALSRLPEREHETARYIVQNLESLQSLARRFGDTLELYRYARNHEKAILATAPPFPESPALPFEMLASNSAVSDEAIAMTELHMRKFHHDVQNYTVARRAKEDEGAQFTSWMRMAAEHGAITAYGFWMTTQSINALVGGTNVIKSKVDEITRKRAGRTFRDAFPQIALIRIRAAHPGELEASPEELAKHMVFGPLEGIIRMDENGSMFLAGMIQEEGDGCRYTATVKQKLVSYELSPITLTAIQTSAAEYSAAFIQLITT